MLALVLLALLPAVARGANVPVTTTADRDNGTCAAGDCSLREAVKYALSGSTVEVPAGTYDLTLGALRIDRPGTRLEIEGPVVDGVPGGEHPTAIVRQTEPAMRVFELVAGDQEIILRHLRITGGRATDASPAWGVQETEAHGGGIVNVGALLLEQVEVDGNSATGSLERAAAGGGISARGSLILRDSRVHDNEVSGVGQDGPRGGGIHISGGSGSLQRSAIDHNEVNGSYGEGGGLSVSFAGMRLEGTRVSDNTITAPAGWADGGGIHLRSGGMLIRRSAITNNTADASASDWRSVGGGIYAAPYILTIESTTIHGNTAAGGEAADNTTNVSKGGGLALTGDVPVHAVNVTVTGNTVTGNDLASGGNVVSGIFNLSENALFLRSSIIAGGSAPAPGTDTCTGIIVSEGYNLVDEANACGLSEATRDRTGVDPQLGPLQDNGGPTPTRVPGAGSPALNLGPGGGCLDIEDRPLRDDQRYTQRGAVCDAGAVDDGATGASTAPAGTPDVAVSTTADRPDAGGCAPGNCTLREALAHAPAGSTVTLAEGRYQLGEGELAAQRAAALSIRGAGAGSTVIEQAPGEAARVLLVSKPASITLAGVTVRGGANEQGGGIRNEGTLHLRDAVVKENTARIGGGIANSGQLYVTNSVIEANEAVGTEQEVQALGGGIYTGAAASIQRSLVARNVARGHGAGPASGGGIAAFLAGGLLLEGTGVEDNKVIGGPGGGAAAGGGISAEGALAGLIPGPPVLSRGSLLAGNEAEATGGGRAIGGGLAATSPSALTLDRTTITGNGVEGDAAEGGGLLIDSGVPVAALGSVIADNSAAGSGASGAQAGFDAVNDAPTLLLGHSVVAGEGTDPCTAGTVISIGSSLVDAGEGECGVGSGEGDLTGTEPLLGPLADHGGPVRTREPLPGSPLIGNGGECIDSLGNPMTLDGRGFPAGSECDIGAYDTSTESSPGVDSGPATGDRPDGPVDPEPTPTPTPTPTPEPTPIATAEPTPGPGPGPTPGPGPGPGPIATPTPTPPPGGGPTPTAKPKAADVIRLPGARRCVSRRKGLRVRLRAPSGDRVVRSTVRAGRKKARRLTGRRARGPLALKGKALPRRGKVKVKVQVRLSSGTNLSRSRTYRICR